MADDAEARREARRRRILENAQSRLEKITGRKEEPLCDSNADQNDVLCSISTPELNGSVPSLAVDDFSSIIRGRASYKKNQSSSSTTLDNDFLHLPDGTQNSPLNPLLTNDTQPEKMSYTQSYFTSKLTICLLAILMRLLHTLQLSYIYGNMIFMPLICLEVFNVTLYQASKESLGMLGATLLLCGFPPTVVNSLAKYLSVVKLLIFDFSLYLFTFILSHLLFSNVDIIFNLSVN